MPGWLNVLLVVVIVLAVVLVLLYIFGSKAQKKQVEQREMMEAMAQNVTMLIIDKKRMKIKDSGLPKQVYESMPKYLRWTKMPIVKAKVGPKIMTFMCDAEVFQLIPVKQEVKAVVSGLYITKVKSIRGSLVTPPKKKKFFDRFRKDGKQGSKPSGETKKKA